LRRTPSGGNKIVAKNIPSLLYDDLIELKITIHPAPNSAHIFLVAPGQRNLVRREAIFLAIY
jgi:hypothetical protein